MSNTDTNPPLPDAYDRIDRFLRNNLYDTDYAEYSEALDHVLKHGIAERDAMVEGLRSEVAALRLLLAVRVAMPGTYFDDGEAWGQEHGITIDFMREPVADIDAKLRALNVARAEIARVKAT